MSTEPAPAPQPPQRNDLVKLRALMEQRGLFQTRAIVHPIIEHDEDCPLINGGIECTCDPDITLLSNAEYLRMLAANKN